MVAQIAYQEAMKTPRVSAHRRTPEERTIRRSLNAKAAEEAVGPITRGCEIYGLSKGQFSLVDLVLHCLRASGPADVVISTWTAAGADIEFAYKLLSEGSIRSLRFLVDFSFPARARSYCAALRERFGDEAIRITKNHCKFVLIRNEAWNLVLRTSMNLNENRRLENYEISDDRDLADYLASVVDSLFAAETGAAAFGKRPWDHCKAFEGFWQEAGAEGSEAAMRNSTDVKKYFGDGPLDNDIRRAGICHAKGGMLR